MKSNQHQNLLPSLIASVSGSGLGVWQDALQNDPFSPYSGGGNKRNRLGNNRQRMSKSRRRMRNKMARHSRQINRRVAK